MKKIFNSPSVLTSTKAERHKFWRAVLFDFSSSGLTLSAYCRANGIDFDLLRRWKYRLNQLDAERDGCRAAAAPAITFKPVVLSNDTALPSSVLPAMRIAVAGLGIEIQLDSALTSGQFSEVLSTLRGLGC